MDSISHCHSDIFDGARLCNVGRTDAIRRLTDRRNLFTHNSFRNGCFVGMVVAWWVALY